MAQTRRVTAGVAPFGSGGIIGSASFAVFFQAMGGPPVGKAWFVENASCAIGQIVNNANSQVASLGQAFSIAPVTIQGNVPNFPTEAVNSLYLVVSPLSAPLTGVFLPAGAWAGVEGFIQIGTIPLSKALMIPSGYQCALTGVCRNDTSTTRIFQCQYAFQYVEVPEAEAGSYLT